MASLANKDQAEKCRDMAKTFLGRGEHEKAVRFFDKSLRLYPLPGVDTMRDIAKSEQDKGDARRQGSSGTSGTADRSGERPAPYSSTNGNSTSAAGGNGSGNSRSNGGGSGAENGTGSAPGVRRRPSTAAPSSGAGGVVRGEGPGGGGGGGSGRAFTEEQERAVKQVLDSKAKGHYAVLGVEKGANEDQIKKAYRKLALRFHPDKNGAPMAHEAFQAIGTAFAVLSDGDKRAHYDRYGDDDGPQGIGGGRGGPFGGRAGYHASEVSPEDIFNMFFGNPNGGVARRQGGGGPFRVYTAGGVRGNGGGGQEGRAQSPMNLLTLVPFIIFMLMSLFGGGPQEAAFSLEKTSKYNVARVTSPKRGVVEGINYYVAPKFRQQFGNNREQLRKVEVAVTAHHRENLRVLCYELQEKRRRLVHKAKQKRRSLTSEAFEQMLHESETLPLPACEEYHIKFGGYSTYT